MLISGRIFGRPAPAGSVPPGGLTGPSPMGTSGNTRVCGTETEMRFTSGGGAGTTA
ncbi:hypothetical protein LUX57_32595 [Actinomadura madurae]|uniref:hypothetical protein n=1 Tax=Actinomadura madurae TaxID=1993 RepID=UPI0020D2397D|nr:hypothetical protein [Actinomadura madurae]MCP9969331.1 hypothetical protein [Actinomadura madurae]